MAAICQLLVACSSPEPGPDARADADILPDVDVEASPDVDITPDADDEPDVDVELDAWPLPDTSPDVTSPVDPEAPAELRYWLVQTQSHGGGKEPPPDSSITLSSPNPGQVVVSLICAGLARGSCQVRSMDAELVGNTVELSFVGVTGSTCGTFCYDMTAVIAGLPPGTYLVNNRGLSDTITVE